MLQVLAEIDSSPASAATGTYNAAMNGCRQLGRLEKVLELWEQMRAASVPPSPESYQHVLVCAMRLQRHAVALDVWQTLNEDPSTTPTVVEYTAAISACERAGDPGRGLSLFDAMQADGITPDSNAMLVAVMAAGRAGLPQRASDILARIELLGARPPTSLYNEAASACLVHGEWKLGAQLLSRMHTQGIPRDAQTYHAVILACAAAGDAARPKALAAVDQLLQEPPARVQGWMDDAALCNAAFAACAATGHWRSAAALLAMLRPPLRARPTLATATAAAAAAAAASRGPMHPTTT